MSIEINTKRSGTGEPKYKGTVSDVLTTSQPNQEILMQNSEGDEVVVGQLAIRAETAFTLRFNGETNVHTFKSGDTFSYTEMGIRSITIVESGATIDYKGEHF